MGLVGCPVNSLFKKSFEQTIQKAAVKSLAAISQQNRSLMMQERNLARIFVFDFFEIPLVLLRENWKV